MIAICPVGPPKLMKPSFSQKRNASAKLTGAGGGAELIASYLGPMLGRPAARVLDRRARRQRSAEFFYCCKLSHGADPSTDTRKPLEQLLSFRREAERSQRRQQEIIGERRRRVSEEALLARELILQYGERALDPRQRGRHHRFVGGNAELRKYHALVHQIEHDVGVVVGAQAADPLVHLRALARFDRLQARTGECFVHVERNRARLVQPESAVLQHGNPAERMPPGVHLAVHLRFGIVEEKG